MSLASRRSGISISTACKSPEEAWELGIEDAFSEGISLIEWPERLGSLLPPRRLEIEFRCSATRPDGPAERRARCRQGLAKAFGRDRRSCMIRDGRPWPRSSARRVGVVLRRCPAGDASFRRYYRLGRNGSSVVLMDAPAPQEDVGPFVAVAEMLRELGLSAPEVHRCGPRPRFSAARGFWRRHLHAAARARRRRTRPLCARGRHSDRVAAGRRAARHTRHCRPMTRRGCSPRRRCLSTGTDRSRRAVAERRGRITWRCGEPFCRMPCCRRRPWCCATTTSTI